MRDRSSRPDDGVPEIPVGVATGGFGAITTLERAAGTATAAAARSALREFRIPTPMRTSKKTYDAAASQAIPYATRGLSEGIQPADCAGPDRFVAAG